MEFAFTPFRILLLVICLVIFGLLGGFSPPELPEGDYRSNVQMAKAWRHCVLVFVVGAASATLVDHFVGNIDRTNLRLLYILLGAILMIGSYIWLKGMKSPLTETATNRISIPVTASHPFFIALSSPI